MATIHTLQTFFAGDDWVITGELTDEFGNPFDPTPATAITWTLDDETGASNLTTLTLAGGGIVIAAAPSGWTVPVAVITVPKAFTSNLTPGTYRDQLVLVVSGLTNTFWQGPIQVLGSNK